MSLNPYLTIPEKEKNGLSLLAMKATIKECQ